MTPIYIAIVLLVLMAVFLVVNRSRGTLFALGASLLAVVVFGAAYLALVTIIVSGM